MLQTFNNQQTQDHINSIRHNFQRWIQTPYETPLVLFTAFPSTDKGLKVVNEFVTQTEQANWRAFAFHKLIPDYTNATPALQNAVKNLVMSSIIFPHIVFMFNIIDPLTSAFFAGKVSIQSHSPTILLHSEKDNLFFRSLGVSIIKSTSDYQIFIDLYNRHTASNSINTRLMLAAIEFRKY